MERTLFLQKLNAQTDREKTARRVPLGVDEQGEIVFSHLVDRLDRYRHTCVSGEFRSQFILREISLLNELNAPCSATFIVLSKNPIYSELLRCKRLNALFPYLRSKDDLTTLLDGIKPLIAQVRKGLFKGRVYLVLDGLESIEEKTDLFLKNYAPFFDETAGLPIEIITGVDFKRTAFKGSPHLFVGEGNCLLTTDEEGVADVTYAEINGMNLPKRLIYPRAEGEKLC